MPLTSEDPARNELVGPTTCALVLWEGGSATYVLRAGESLNLGRHRDCEIVIALPSVSRHHARLIGAERGTETLALLEDTGGMDGVRVGGRRIPVNEPVPVGAGDIIELGGALVVLYASSDKAMPSAGALVRATVHPTVIDPTKAAERLMDIVAASDLSVLFLGEKGAGKTSAAEAIHAWSARANAPLVRLDCSALPRSLLEGTLFGHESGGAGGPAAKAGLLEAGGTVLLDEVSEMPLATQEMLLSVMSSGSVVRLGGVDERRIDVRFLATSTRDLVARTREGAFLLDLYHCLGGISVLIPPLRERTAEIPRLARRFLAEASMRAGRIAPRLSNEALGVLVHHSFPGNLRELRDAMVRACALAPGSVVDREHLQLDTKAVVPPPTVALAPTRRFRPMPATEPPSAFVDETPPRKT